MDVEVVRQKVQRILTEKLNSVSLRKDGFFVQNGSAGIFVDVDTLGEYTVVKVVSPMLRNVALTDELFRWVATDGQTHWFAHARVMEDPRAPGMGMILWEHDLLGDFLDPDELMTTLSSVASGADDLDDELQSMFGGIKWTDD